MSVCIELEANEFEKRRLVAGGIWVGFDGECFPESGWYDFPVVILGWWLHAVKPLIAGESAKCECLFMDGPFKFVVSKRSGTTWVLDCVHDSKHGEQVVLNKECPAVVLIAEMLSAAGIVIDKCHQNGWESSDLITLEAERAEVNQLMDSFRV